VNLLLVPASYPHPAAEWAGAMNEHSAVALRGIVQRLAVLAPRPYVPRSLAFNDRWKAYALAPRKHVRRGITVYRPAYPLLPRVGQAFWPSRAAFVFSRRLARALHREIDFDAILSFDLAVTGGLAWRLGKDLGIPACGWATGSDIRWKADTPIGQTVRKALGQLDLVFYQSGELKALGAELLNTSADALPKDRHVVQWRGVREPDTLRGEDVRRAVRSRLQLTENQVVILYLGRIAQAKGIFELVDVFAHWGTGHADVVLLLVGSRPGYDETPALQKKIDGRGDHLNGRIRILPGCPPDAIWDYFTASDIFAFPSFREGMPNSLLEAMLGNLPAVAFSIPSVQEITQFGEGLVEVPPYDFSRFGEALLRLAADPTLRREIGGRGRAIAREHFSVYTNMRAVVAHIERLTASPANCPA
jgi:teichuronic acid biosynthesis glycosyltransferase TuaC